MPRSYAYDVFVSYAHEPDTPIAEQLVEWLEAAHPEWRVFIDRQELELGRRWHQSIAKALESSKVFVALLGSAYVASPMCGKEWELASNCEVDGRLTMFTIKTEPKAELPPRYTVKQYVETLGGRLPRTRFKLLLAQIEEAVAALEPPPPTQRWAFLNFKGGVGKTTLAVAMAEHLASSHGGRRGRAREAHRVLFVDADHQANATALLSRPEQTAALLDGDRNLDRLLQRGLVLGRTEPKELARHIHSDVSRIDTAREHLDLLPASHRLFDLDLRIRRDHNRRAAKEGVAHPNRELAARRRSLAHSWERLLDSRDYAFVIIDTGPQLNLAAHILLESVDHLAVPIAPGPLSIRGFNYLLERLREGDTLPSRPRPRLLIVNGVTKKGRSRAQRSAISSAAVLAQTHGMQQLLFNVESELANAADLMHGRYKTFASKYKSRAGEIARQLADATLLAACAPF